MKLLPKKKKNFVNVSSLDLFHHKPVKSSQTGTGIELHIEPHWEWAALCEKKLGPKEMTRFGPDLN